MGVAAVNICPQLSPTLPPALSALASHNHGHVTISLRESTSLVYHYQQAITTTLIPRGLFDSGLTNLLLRKVLTSRLMIDRGGMLRCGGS